MRNSEHCVIPSTTVNQINSPRLEYKALIGSSLDVCGPHTAPSGPRPHVSVLPVYQMVTGEQGMDDGQHNNIMLVTPTGPHLSWTRAQTFSTARTAATG